jgi:xanthine dehydrogenase accessory factor
LAGDLVAEVEGEGIFSPFDGVLRGLLHEGLVVTEGMKVGDVDPRGDPMYCMLISDKSLAIGGGVLEAILSMPKIREKMF